MKVTLDREGNVLGVFGFVVDAQRAVKEYEKTCRELSHQINVPGFRRGKAPRSIIEKQVGVEYIKARALDKLVPQLLSDAIMSESLDVITEPQIDSCQFDLGEPLKLGVKFEVRPEVTLGDYSNIEVNVPQAALPAEALERAMKSIAESKASLQAVPPRPVAMGDTVVLDFECYVADKLVEGGKTEGLVLEMKPGAFIEGFCEQVEGKSPGDDFEVKVKFPEDYRNKELAGKDAVFKVKLKEIRQRVVPELDDELAKSMGQESLDSLRNILQERLSEEIAQENEMRAQQAVVKAVVERATVDIPESMIEREQNLLLQQVRRYMEQNNQSYQALEESEEFKKVKDSKLEEAKQRVLTSLVLGAIVRAEQLTIAEEELGPYIQELAMRYNVGAQQIFQQLQQNEELGRQLMEEVLTNKVVQHLLSKAKVNYIPDEGGHEHHHHDHEHHDHEHHDHEHHDHEHHGHSHSDKESQKEKSAKSEKADKSEKVEKAGKSDKNEDDEQAKSKQGPEVDKAQGKPHDKETTAKDDVEKKAAPAQKS